MNHARRQPNLCTSFSSVSTVHQRARGGRHCPEVAVHHRLGKTVGRAVDACMIDNRNICERMNETSPCKRRPQIQAMTAQYRAAEKSRNSSGQKTNDPMQTLKLKI